MNTRNRDNLGMTKVLAVLMMAALIVIDQIIKHWAATQLQPVWRIAVIPGFFYLTYVRNFGAAFGILQGQRVLLTVVVILVLASGLYFILSGRVRERFVIWTVALILAGGAGNLIDRITRGYVVDYLDFGALFGFPVFNFADCCVVIGTFLLVIYVLRTDYAAYKRKGTKESDDSGNTDAESS